MGSLLSQRYFSLMKEENLLKICGVLTERVERTTVSSRYKPLLDLTFCICSMRKVLFLSEKSLGILKSDVCRNPDVVARFSRSRS